MKAVSGKFHPIFQWFYFDSVESLPENLPLPPEEVDLQVPPLNTGHKLQLRVVGGVWTSKVQGTASLWLETAELLSQGLLPARCNKVQSRAACWCQHCLHC